MADNDEEEIQEAEPVAEPKSRARNWIRYVIVSVILVVGGVWGAKEVQQRFTHVYEYDARIAGSLITVSSRVAGWVTKINVAEGDEVAKGQVVFAIDSRNSELFVDQLVAQIQGVDAERQRLRAEKDLVDKKNRGPLSDSKIGTKRRPGGCEVTGAATGTRPLGTETRQILVSKENRLS